MNEKLLPHECPSVRQVLPKVSGAASDSKRTAHARWGVVRTAVTLRSVGRSLSRRHRSGKGSATPLPELAGACRPAQCL